MKNERLPWVYHRSGHTSLQSYTSKAHLRTKKIGVSTLLFNICTLYTRVRTRRTPKEHKARRKHFTTASQRSDNELKHEMIYKFERISASPLRFPSHVHRLHGRTWNMPQAEETHQHSTLLHSALGFAFSPGEGFGSTGSCPKD